MSAVVDPVPVGPPATEAILLERAHRLAGRRLDELAPAAGLEVPATLRRAKGWTGRLLERLLGATAASRSVPDFEALGIELKSLPVDRTGAPRETTYVCTVDLTDVDDVTWHNSRIRHKLARVLWIPILAEPELLPGERVVGTPVLWSPDPEEERALAADFDAHMDAIRQGQVDAITAHDGRFLQIRPKAANNRALTWSVDERGEAIMTLPRGFYLRTSFTAAILSRHFGL